MRERTVGQRSPDRERSLDAVLRRLEDDDPLSPREVFVVREGAPRHLLEDVEVLARHHLRAHSSELGASGATGRDALSSSDAGIHQFVAPAEQEISEQERRRGAVGLGASLPAAFAVKHLEGAVHAWLAATQIGVVHDVVVHEGGRVEDLEAGGDRHDRVQAGVGPERVGRRLVGGDGAPPPVTEQRPESFATREEPTSGIVDRIEIGGDAAQLRPKLGEEAVETSLHDVH